MFDVGQNTARISSLLSIYYQAEATVEGCTEAKLGLTLQASENTKLKNDQENALIDKYSNLVKSAAAGEAAEIGGVSVGCGKHVSGDGASGYVFDEKSFKSAYEAANPKPNENDPNYKHVKVGDKGYETKGFEDFKYQAAAEAGSAPTAPNKSDSKYITQNDDGSTGFNQDKYDTDMRKYEADKDQYEKNINNRANQLAQNYNNDLNGKVTRENDARTQKFEIANKSWESDMKSAVATANAYVAAMNGKSTALTQQRSDEMTKMQNAWDSETQDLNMQECQLDQQIQQAQAVVTATKTEIDSLKQERNSNAQSDFKLFG